MITLLFAFHQGNGPERDFLDDDRVYIFDMFNRQIYPQDGFAKSLYFLVTVWKSGLFFNFKHCVKGSAQ